MLPMHLHNKGFEKKSYCAGLQSHLNAFENVIHKNN